MSASVSDSAAPVHSAFYRFVRLGDPAAVAGSVRHLADGLRGSVVVAPEGISGAVAGAPDRVAEFEQALQQTALAMGAFSGMAFKRSACSTTPFGRLKVSVKPELVSLGVQADQLVGPAGDTVGGIDASDSSHLSPQAWRELLKRGDAVVLDNRNHFEFRLGHFRGAVDPQVHNFRDFATFVQANAPAWREAGRPVAMYCTGGIRCDKTAPWLRSLGLQVWQLDGGVLNYFQQLPDAEGDATQDADRLWQGECFVFDNRIALDAGLQETSTTADQVYDDRHADEAWRLKRARRLDASDGV